MDYLKSLSNLYKGGIPNFPYNLGDKVYAYEGHSLWTLHVGTKRDDSSPVSIFAFDIQAKRDKLPIARNALRKFKTIRHPDVLKFFDGVETDTFIYIATEPVQPLQQQLDSHVDAEFLTWGLYKVAIALKFINNDAASVHGNVRVSSIFTTKAGEWKLGGFDLLSNLKEENPVILTFGGLVPDSGRYASPEIKKGSWQLLKDLDPGATDSYNFATLIYEAYNGPFTNPEQLTQRGSIPNSLFNAYRRLLSPSPKSRPGVAAFMENGLKANGYFQNELIQVNDFLENLSVKDQAERDTFFRKLNNTLEQLPSNFQKYKVLPTLINAFEYGAGGVKTLAPIIRIGKNLTEEEYATMVVASIVKMFASPDRAMRLSLLESMADFIDNLSNKVVNDSIFTHMVTGFADTAPIIREQTVKAVMLIVPKLSDRNVNNDLLRHLSKTQMDEQPGIRTNTTICLGKIAKYLNDGTKRKVLVPAFTRSLRDSFVHARNAGLMALAATCDSYEALDCATKIIPSVSVLLIDKEKIVRTQAFKTLDIYIKRLEKLAATMPESAIVQNGSGAQTPTGGATGTAGALAGWAVESLTRQLAGTNIAAQPPTPVNGSSSHLSVKSTDSSPSTTAPTTPSLARANSSQSVQSLSSAFGATTASKSLAPQDSSGDLMSWGDEDEAAGDDDPWASFDAPAPVAPPKPKPSPSAVSRPGSRKTNSISSVKSSSSAGGAMKLGGAAKSSRLSFVADQIEAEEGGWGEEDAWGSMDPVKEEEKTIEADSADPWGDFATPTSSRSSTPLPASTDGGSKADRQAELAKRREERRARMESAKAKKAAGLGAKKV